LALATAAAMLIRGTDSVDDWVGERFLAVAGRALTGDLSAGEIAFEAPLTARLTDVTLTAESGEVVATVRQLEIALEEVPSPDAPLRIARVALEEPTLHLMAREGPDVAFVGFSPLFVESPLQQDESSDDRAGDDRAGDEVDLVLRRLSITDGTLRLSDAEGRQMALDRISVDIDVTPGEGGHLLAAHLGRAPVFDLTATGRLDLAGRSLDLRAFALEMDLSRGRGQVPPRLAELLETHDVTGRLSVDAAGRIDLREPWRSDVALNAEAADMHAGGVHLRVSAPSVELAVALAGGRARIETAQAEVAGGIARFSEAEDRQGALAGVWEISGVDLSAFRADEAGSALLAGRLDARGALEIPGDLTPGRVTVESLQVVAPDGSLDIGGIDVTGIGLPSPSEPVQIGAIALKEAALRVRSEAAPDTLLFLDTLTIRDPGGAAGFALTSSGAGHSAQATGRLGADALHLSALEITADLDVAQTWHMLPPRARVEDDVGGSGRLQASGQLRWDGGGRISGTLEPQNLRLSGVTIAGGAVRGTWTPATLEISGMDLLLPGGGLTTGPLDWPLDEREMQTRVDWGLSGVDLDALGGVGHLSGAGTLGLGVSSGELRTAALQTSTLDWKLDDHTASLGAVSLTAVQSGEESRDTRRLQLSAGDGESWGLRSGGALTGDTLTVSSLDWHADLSEETAREALLPMVQSALERVDRGTLRASMSGDLTTLHLDGAVTLTDARIDVGGQAVPVGRAETELSIRGDRIDAPTTARLLGGRLEIPELTLEDDVARLRWDARALQLQDLPGRDEPLRGVLTSAGVARIRLGETARFLSGGGTLEISGGRLFDMPVLAPLLSRSRERASGPHSLDSRFQLGAVGVQVDELTVTLPVVRFTGSGVIYTDGELDLTMRGGRAPRGGRLVEYHLIGTTEQPALRIEPLGREIAEVDRQDHLTRALGRLPGAARSALTEESGDTEEAAGTEELGDTEEATDAMDDLDLDDFSDPW